MLKVLGIEAEDGDEAMVKVGDIGLSLGGKRKLIRLSEEMFESLADMVLGGGTIGT